MSLKNWQARREAGDTIVEVMIVLAILGLAISTSYAIANRSLLNARQAQESSIATELAQSQIEQIRRLIDRGPTDANNVFLVAAPQRFCIDGSGDVAKTGFINDLPADFAHYPPACVNGFYHISVKYDPSSSNDDFTVRVLWDNVAGQGTDSVTVSYRIHKENIAE